VWTLHIWGGGNSWRGMVMGGTIKWGVWYDRRRVGSVVAEDAKAAVEAANEKYYFPDGKAVEVDPEESENEDVMMERSRSTRSRNDS